MNNSLLTLRALVENLSLKLSTMYAFTNKGPLGDETVYVKNALSPSISVSSTACPADLTSVIECDFHEFHVKVEITPRENQ